MDRSEFTGLSGLWLGFQNLNTTLFYDKQDDLTAGKETFFIIYFQLKGKVQSFITLMYCPDTNKVNAPLDFVCIKIRAKC